MSEQVDYVRSVGWWRDGRQYDPGDLVVIESELEEFVDDIAEELHGQPIILYLSNPSARSVESIVLYYLASIHDRTVVRDEDRNRDVEALLREWDEYAECSAQLNGRRAEEVAAKLRSAGAEHYFLWRVRELTNLINELRSLLAGLLTTPTPLGEMSHTQYISSWWQLERRYLDDLRRLQSAAKAVDYGDATEFRACVRQVLKELDSVLPGRGSVSVDTDLRALATLLLWSARYWKDAGIPGLCVLLSHRAIDTYLMAVGWEEGLITFDGERPRYSDELRRKSGQGRPRDVGVVLSEQKLVEVGVWAKDGTRRDFVHALNDQRNRLIFAHGAYRAKREDADWAYRGVEGLLRTDERLSGPVVRHPWDAVQDAIGSGLIFMFEKDFSSMVRKVMT